MFNSKMKQYPLQKLATTVNLYGEKVKKYTDGGNIMMFISLLTYNQTNINDVRLTECTHIGLCDADSCKKGDIINGRFEVQFINNEHRPVMIFMKEVDNNGTSNCRG